MDLAELITRLIQEEGLTEDEATAVAVARLKASRGTAMSRTGPTNFPVSAQQYANGVDYGEETPEEALERWTQQEMADPNGIYGGGATSGGVFGDGSIALNHFDPGAVQREVNLRTSIANARTQAEMLRLMNDIRAELHQVRQHELPPAQQETSRREFDTGRGPRRRLSQKKRGSR